MALHTHTVLDAPAPARHRLTAVAMMNSAVRPVRIPTFPLAGAGAGTIRLVPPCLAAALALQRLHAVAVALHTAALRPVLSVLVVAMAVAATAETSPVHAALLEDRGGPGAPPVVMIEPDLPRRPRHLAHARLDAAAAETVRLRLHLTVALHLHARAGTAPGAVILVHRPHPARVVPVALITSKRDLPPPLTTTETSALMFARIVIVATAAAGVVTAEAKAHAGTTSGVVPLTGMSQRRGARTHHPLSHLLRGRTAGLLRLPTPLCVMRRRTRLVNNLADGETIPLHCPQGAFFSIRRRLVSIRRINKSRCSSMPPAQLVLSPRKTSGKQVLLAGG